MTDRLIGSERVLVEGELRPAVVRTEGDRIAQVWWGTSDPESVAAQDDGMLGAPPPRQAAVWNVRDRVVLPGGVDTHVHVDEPGRTHREGFTAAARAAAYGGVTTIVDMPLSSIPPTTTVEALRVKQAAARAASGRLPVDVAFWGGAVPGNADDLEPLWDAGVLGFTAFLAGSGVPELPPLDADELIVVMDRLVRFDGLLAVHAGTAAVRTLLDAVRETGARTHVLDVSSAEVLDLLAEAKAEGLPVTAETCHHYLVLAAEDVPDGDAACSPTIRDPGNRDALWDGLRDGILDCVVSDHSPSSVAGTGFAALADAARRRGVSLADVSRWTSADTAALVGLDRGDRPKGIIAEGAAADLVIYDPDSVVTVDAARLAHRNPVSAYDGLTATGEVKDVVLGGEVVLHGFSEGGTHGRLLLRPGSAAAEQAGRPA